MARADFARLKKDALRLDSERKGLEQEMDELFQQLGTAGMKEPLVDGEMCARAACA